MSTQPRLDQPFAGAAPRRWRWAAFACVAWAAALLGLFAARQAPLGGVRGSLIAADTGQPMAGAELLLAPADASVPGRARRLLVNAQGRFHLTRLHAGDYLVSAQTRAHRLPPTRLTIPEGRATEVLFELAPTSPFLDVFVPQPVFVPGEPVQVTAHGFTRDEALVVEAYRLDPLRVVREAEGSLWRALVPGDMRQRGFPDEPVSLASLPGVTPTLRLTPKLPRDAEGIFQRRITLPLRRPGLYLIACRADGLERLNWLMITDLGLVVKRAHGHCLTYAVDLETGAPAAGARLALFSGTETRATATCDGGGIASLPLNGADESTLVMARRGESLAFVRLWSGGGEGDGNQHLFLYTDRPVYRPGQRVHFKGLARLLEGADFRVPAPGPVRLEVRDPRDTLIFAAARASNDFGSFFGDFTLSREAATGVYTLVAERDETRFEHTFSVAAYRKPEYSVAVRAEQESYTRGEPGWVEVEARYFFGAPVVGAGVEYTVMRSPRWGWESDEAALPYGESAGEGEVVAYGEARTDARGRCRIRFETAPERRAGESEAEASWVEEHDYRYSIEATITDRGHFSATGSASVNVWRGEYALSVDADRMVAGVGDTVAATATVRDHHGEALTGVPVTLSLVRRDWEDDEFTLVTAGSGQAKSDAQGKASSRFRVPRAGSYQVVASARDGRGNRVRATGYLWVSGDGEPAAAAHGPDLQVVADRKEYQPGDTATFLINTARPGATALVTAEAGAVMMHTLVPLRGRSTPFRLPITRAHLPNFHLSVCLVRGKEFVEQVVPVNVTPRPRALQLEVSADRESYAPGDRATYRIRVRDAAGRPVQAELSLGVVDESIYAIQEDGADILRAFYPRRYNAVETSFSFPPVYLSGPDKSGAADSVRKEFPDTALWAPAIVTDARGEATVHLQVPDSLTAWRATVRAHTRGTLVGQATSRMVCRKELMVRLQAPRFFNARDDAVVSAMVHNETDTLRLVRVTLRAEGVALEGSGPVERRLQPGEVARFDWKVVAEQPGTARLVATAEADTLRDAVELRLPVRPHGRARVETRAGALSGDGVAEEKFVLRPDATGEVTLTLQLAPSLASGMLSALRFLAAYPYGCTEQTMSAFLPDLVVNRALSGLGLHSPRLQAQIPEMVNAGLQRLYRYQHPDGGWGWWEYDDSDAGMTAYVIEGLVEAREAGFVVNESVLKRGAEWLLAHERARQARALRVSAERVHDLLRAARGGVELASRLPSRPYGQHPPPLDGTTAQALLALARAGQPAPLALALAVGQTGHVRDPVALARLSLAARHAGRNADADALLRRLRSLARESDAFCHWANDPETTALALQALLSAPAGDTRAVASGMAPKVVRWLLAQRNGDHWVSTRGTARVLFALVDYLSVSGETAPNYSVVPVVNGRSLPPVRFTRDSIFQPETQVTVPAALLRPQGENRVALRKQGAGNLYYSVRLRQFIGQEEIPVLVGGAGIVVQRSYHRLRPARDPEDGELRLLPDAKPVRRLRAGQTYLGRIVIRSAAEYDHLVIEEPLPAGCEPLDRGRLDREEWDRWWTDMDIRDEQIAFFARRLKPGEHQLEYYLRAAVPGEYHIMPTQVSGMYDPSISAGGAETRLEVR